MSTSAASFDLPVPVGYALAAASRFVLNFGASPGGSGEPAPVLNLAFALDGSWEPVGMRIVDPLWHRRSCRVRPDFWVPATLPYLGLRTHPELVRG